MGMYACMCTCVYEVLNLFVLYRNVLFCLYVYRFVLKKVYDSVFLGMFLKDGGWHAGRGAGMYYSYTGDMIDSRDFLLHSINTAPCNIHDDEKMLNDTEDLHNNQMLSSNHRLR